MHAAWEKQKAFTIVELLIVIVVIAILAAITIVAYAGIQQRASVAAVSSNLSQARKALEVARAESLTESYPSTLPATISEGNGSYYYSAFISPLTNPGYCLTYTENSISYFVTSASADPVPGSCEGMVGWWKLNANANDSSGYNNNGTVYGATPAVGQSGDAGGAYSFNGTSQYIDLASLSVLPAGLSDRTMCGWGLASNIVDTRWIVAYGTPTTKQAMFIGLKDGALYGGGYSADAIATGYWSTAVWRHICLTYDGTVGRVYGDGQERANRTDTWNLVRSAFYIGRQVYGGQYWAGSIDDVRIYNRVLSPAEIQALYAAGAQ